MAASLICSFYFQGKLKRRTADLMNLCPTLDPESSMTEFEKASIIAFSNIYLNTTITGRSFRMAKNIYHRIIDIGEKLHYETGAEFNTKIKCTKCSRFFQSVTLSMALLSWQVTMICPKSWFLILKHTTLEKKEAEGPKGAELNPHFSQNFGTSVNGHVTICQEHTTV